MSNIISFDWAIKNILRDKADYEIIEGFINALLKDYGYGHMKIKATTDPESNKYLKKQKKSIADFLIVSEDGKVYTIEVDRNPTAYFLHKASFTSSKTSVDHISQGTAFSEIIKNIHISIVYFDIKSFKDCIYHGYINFRDRQGNSMEEPIIINSTMQIKPRDVFSEFFIICIPKFNNEAKAYIDEWLYFMKNENIKPEFSAPGLAKAAKRLEYLKLSPEEQIDYDRYIKEQTQQTLYITEATEGGIAIGEKRGIAIGKEEGLAIGEERGKEIGKKERDIEIAKNLLALKIPIDQIASATGLSVTEIDRL